MRMLLPILLGFFWQVITYAQPSIQPGCVSGNFGIDADVNSNRLQFISGSPLGTDDWFKVAAFPGPGVGVIDTTGAAALYSFYTDPANINVAFEKRMAFTYFESVNGSALIDGVFARDYFGGGNSAGNFVDSTAFNTASKNGENPAIWASGVQGVQGKNDILDVYGHLRKIGNNATDPSWLYCGVSVLDPSGERYIDFEFYQQKLTYNKTTNKFSSGGPDNGHTAFLFDATGRLTRAGDLIFSVKCPSSGEPTLELRIWVARNIYEAWKDNPPANLPFKFGENFDQVGATYGYADILPKTGTFFDACGKVNTSAPTAPAGPWGTVNSSSGYGMTYDQYQFIELGFNLSSVGLDPLAINAQGNGCAAAFQSYIVKSRASNSFTAQLKDFAGPYDFGGPPALYPSITSDAITCDSTQVSLKATVTPALTQLYYKWTLPDGSVQAGTHLNTIRASLGGTYKLEMSPVAGCDATGSTTYVMPFDTISPASPTGAQNAMFCPGTTIPSISVNDPGAGFETRWYANASGGAVLFTGNVFQPASEGTYYAETRDQRNGCVSPRIPVSVTPYIKPNITASASPAVICQGETSELSFSPSAGLSVVGWYINTDPDDCGTGTVLGTGSTLSVSPMSTASYSVIVESADGCLDTACVSVTVNPKPELSLGSGPECNTAKTSYTIRLAISSGTAPFTAAATEGVASVNGNIVTVSNITSGFGTHVGITDANGCSDSYTQAPYSCGDCPVNAGIVSSDPDNTICLGESVQISGSATGGVAPYVYQWSPNIGSGAGPFSVSPTATTTYQLVVTDDNGNGCSDTTEITITVNPKPELDLASGPQCNTAQTHYSISLMISSGTAPFTAAVTEGVASVNGNIVTVSNISSGFGTLVGITDANGCSDSFTQAPYSCGDCPVNAGIVSSDPDNTICSGASVEFSGSATGGVEPYVYQWSPNIGSGAGPFTVSPTSTTTYQLVITDDNGNGCSDTTTITIGVNPVDRVSLNEEICFGESFTVGNSVFTSTGNYVVTLQNQFGCDSIISLSLSVGNCQAADTIPFTVYVNDTITVCDLAPENGTNVSNAVGAGLCGGGTTGSSIYGSWSVGANGCLTFHSSNNAGNNVETICVLVCDATGRCDTTYYVATIIPTTDTIPETVCQTCTETICFEGVIPDNFVNSVTTTLCDGSLSTTTTYASYSIDDDGCLVVDGGTIPGRDTICVTTCDPVIGQCDTTIIIIEIPPVKDTIPFTVHVKETIRVCDPALENGTAAGNIVSAGLCSGGMQGSSIYGSWSVDAEGCLNFSAANNAGNNVGIICVSVCDAAGNCDTTYYIPTIIPTTDTIPDTVCQGCTQTICFDGVIPDNFVNNVTTTLCDGSLSTTTIFASYSIDDEGCLVVVGGTIPGRDTICVTTCDPVVGQCDTTIVIIEVPGIKDTIRFNVFTDSTVTICDPQFENGSSVFDVVSASLCDGATGSSSIFGTWTVDNTTGCLTYTANNITGVEVDAICVVACDGDGRCDTTIYLSTIIPAPPVGPCFIDALGDVDTITLTCDSTGRAELCIPITQIDLLLNYDLFVDGQLYVEAPGACDPALVGSYDLGEGIRSGRLIFAPGVSNIITGWSVNGSSLLANDTISSISELVAEMQVSDPAGGWMLAPGDRITGGVAGSTYGLLKIDSKVGDVLISTFNAEYSSGVVYHGATISLPEGCHKVTIVDSLGCTDSIYVCVECPCYTQVFEPADTTVIACDGIGEGKFCMPLTQLDLLTNYQLFVDGELYTEAPGACDPALVGSYDMGEGIRTGRLVFGPGITTIVNSWTVNGANILTDTIASLSELVSGMNNADPAGSWSLTPGDRIAGGANGSTYGAINIEAKIGEQSIATFDALYTSGVIYFGSSIDLSIGCHLVKLVNEEGCSDSIVVCVECPVDTIYDSIPVTDTLVICKDVLGGGSGDTFTLCDGSVSGSGVHGSWEIVDSCLVFVADTILGNDTICTIVCDPASGYCDTTIIIITVTPKVILENDYVADCSDRIDIDILANDVIYGEVGSVEIVSSPLNGIVEIVDGIAVYTADPDFVRGIDSFSYAVCTQGAPAYCDTAIVIIDRSLCNTPPVAVNDSAHTDPGESVDVIVLGNDYDPDGDPVAMCDGQMSIITQPQHGTVTVIDDSTVQYVPANGHVGIDSFQYVICDPGGLRDSAWVYITVDPLDCLIPEAISPNGDMYNDYFIIPCIGDEPANLRIWNRWGSEVYHSEHYKNDWNGDYKGSPLPDGTYYYVLKYTNIMGKNVDRAGFVVIHR